MILVIDRHTYTLTLLENVHMHTLLQSYAPHLC
jgi:hypothetical protein